MQPNATPNAAPDPPAIWELADWCRVMEISLAGHPNAARYGALARAMRELERTRPVIDAAVAYCDQLGSFNVLTHPEVHRWRIELARAVSALHRAAL